MSTEYQILTDATSDVNNKWIDEYNFEVLPMPFIINNIEMLHYADYREISVKEFYEKIRKGAKSMTAQINYQTYNDYFEKYLKENKNVLYICFSSALSGQIDNARAVAKDLNCKYLNNKVVIVDSLCASVGQGLLVLTALKKRKEGVTFDDLTIWLEQNKLNLAHWFTVDDLNHLHRGGRVSKATAVVGSLLQIKPVLHVNNKGELINVSKAKGRKRALFALAEHMKNDGINLDNQTVFIGHGDDIDAANLLADYIKESIKVKNIEILPIGPVIGTHSGPGTIALFFFGKLR